MQNYGGNYRRTDFPTEFNYQSNSFSSLRPRTERVGGIYRYQRRKKSRKRFYGLMVFLFISFSTYYFLFSGSSVKISENAPLAQSTLGESVSFAAQVEAQNNNEIPISSSTSPSYSSLEQAVASALEGTKGDYAFYIKNLKTAESYYRNENKQYQPGSLYKLWVMGAVFEQIEQGNLTEDDELSRTIPYLNSKFGISPENAEQTNGTISLTVNQALNQMITISHNYAAMLLTEKIKLSTVAQYLKDRGFYNSRVGTGGDEPLTTPADIGLFFEKLYKNELESAESNQKMLDFLKKQQKNNKLPLYTPSDLVMAHKTGELGMFSHDAGIVYTPKGDYIIVAFSETPSPKGAEDRIALVSKAVYEYFMSQ